MLEEVPPESSFSRDSSGIRFVSVRAREGVAAFAPSELLRTRKRSPSSSNSRTRPRNETLTNHSSDVVRVAVHAAYRANERRRQNLWPLKEPGLMIY